MTKTEATNRVANNVARGAISPDGQLYVRTIDGRGLEATGIVVPHNLTGQARTDWARETLACEFPNR